MGEELELSLLGVLLEDVEFDGYCPALILGSAQNSVNVDKSALLVEPDEDASSVKMRSKCWPGDISIPGVGTNIGKHWETPSWDEHNIFTGPCVLVKLTKGH